MLVLKPAFLIYQKVFSPALHAFALLLGVPKPGCRHETNCSREALRLIEEKGFFSGFFLALARVLQCHPWGKGTK